MEDKVARTGKKDKTLMLAVCHLLQLIQSMAIWVQFSVLPVSLCSFCRPLVCLSSGEPSRACEKFVLKFFHFYSKDRDYTYMYMYSWRQNCTKLMFGPMKSSCTCI